MCQGIDKPHADRTCCDRHFRFGLARLKLSFALEKEEVDETAAVVPEVVIDLDHEVFKKINANIGSCDQAVSRKTGDCKGEFAGA
jgi:hypothetical protein